MTGFSIGTWFWFMSAVRTSVMRQIDFHLGCITPCGMVAVRLKLAYNSHYLHYLSRYNGSTWSSTKVTAWRTTTANWRKFWIRTTSHHTVCYWPARRCRTSCLSFGRCSTSCYLQYSRAAPLSSSGSTLRSLPLEKRWEWLASIIAGIVIEPFLN